MTRVLGEAVAEPLITECGRRIEVGATSIPGPGPQAGRVTLDVGPEVGGFSKAWAGLRPAQARRLAQQLLEEAARAEQRAGTRLTPNRGAVEVEPAGPHAWAATARGRHLFTTSDGPLGSAPTPAEMLVGAVATCAAARTDQFLAGRGLSSEAVHVRATFDEYDDRPSRISAIRLNLTLPPGLTEQDRHQLHEALARCTVTNTLRQPPQLAIGLH